MNGELTIKIMEYYLSRSSCNFDAVQGLYRTNKLHLAARVCVQDFCEYWGLDDLHMVRGHNCLELVYLGIKKFIW